MKAGAVAGQCALLIGILLVCVIPAFGRTAAAQEPPDLDPRIVKLVGIDFRTIVSASSEEARKLRDAQHAFIDRFADAGIGAARQWILDEMKSYSPKLQVSFDTYQVAPQGRITRDVEAAQRDGGPSRTEPAADLRQRPLRHPRAARRPGHGERRPPAPPGSRRAERRRRPIPTRRSTTWRPA